VDINPQGSSLSLSLSLSLSPSLSSSQSQLLQAILAHYVKTTLATLQSKKFSVDIKSTSMGAPHASSAFQNIITPLKF